MDFVDDWREDVISTDRQSLNWDLEKTLELREFRKKVMLELERKWRLKRNENRKEKIQLKTNVNITNWYKDLPPEILSNIEPIINQIMEDSELVDEAQSDLVQKLHSLIPEYPYYHWRHIHTKVQDASKQYYKDQNYYTAFLEAVKKYIGEVRTKSGSTNSSERSMMGEVFSNRKLSTTKKYKKSDGSNFGSDTIKNIEEGQHFLSEGVLIGCRHPISHEEIKELKESGLFSDSDCLDALSLLSHLFRRLEDSEIP